MKLSWPTRLLIAAGLFGTGTYIYWRWDSKRRRLAALEHRKSIRKKREKKEQAKGAANMACLEPYLQPGAKLSPQIRDSLTYASRFVDPNEAIGIDFRTQMGVFTLALREASLGNAGDLDRLTEKLLRSQLPDCPWDEVAMPPEDESDWALVYAGVQELVQLAALESRYDGFRALPGDGDSTGSGLVCPGWDNQAPALTFDVTGRVGDYIEVMLGAEDEDGTPTYVEPAYAVVTSKNGSEVEAELVGPQSDVPVTLRPPAIQGTREHGYAVGDTLNLTSRCIYAIHKKDQS